MHYCVASSSILQAEKNNASASYWRIISPPPCEPDACSDPNYFALQFYSDSTEHEAEDGVFLVIYKNSYQLRQRSYVKQYGVFSYKYN